MTTLRLAALLVFLAGKTLAQPTLHFRMQRVSTETYESVGAFDVNGDGQPDLVSGGFWYEGPGFVKRYVVGPVRREGEYYDDFSTIPMDVNGDGRMDFVTGGWWGNRVLWRENPGDPKKEWPEHVIGETGNVETTRTWDVDGDGFPEIVPNNPGHPLKFYRLNRDAAGKALGTFSEHKIFSEKQGHLIVGQAHGYGLDWYEQTAQKTWKKHPIDPHNSQYHEMAWVDLDGDRKPELLTGKRYRAHNDNDPGSRDDYGLYYFTWNGESFSKQIISYGPVGVGKGTGIHFAVTDLNRDGRPDVAVAGKDGLAVFFNEGVVP